MVSSLRGQNITLQQGTFYEDTRLATDYRGSMLPDDLRLAVRVRSFSHLHRFGNEFVLRDTAPFGVPTEADKVLTDPRTAQIYLYAFTDLTGARFAQYILVDLPALRRTWQGPERDLLRPQEIRFPDGGRALSLPVDALQESGGVIAARLAERTFDRQREARAALETLGPYLRMAEADRPRAEMLLMHACYATTEYQRDRSS